MTTDTTEPPTADGRTDEQPCLVADDVSREFGSVTVVDEVSLVLERGTLHALIGPNGSGKTTALRLFGKLLSPTEGTVAHNVGDHRRVVGYLPQQPAFRPSFSALETLEFYAALVDDDAEALLSRVGLEDAADRRVEELSGGMTRLLGLAQATAGDPPIVLLDEPGSGLDPRMRRATIDVARSLADEGAAVLYSTHDLGLAERHCDRISILDAGSLVATGPPVALAEQYDATTLRGVFESAVTDRDDGVAVVGETDG